MELQFCSICIGPLVCIYVLDLALIYYVTHVLFSLWVWLLSAQYYDRSRKSKRTHVQAGKKNQVTYSLNSMHGFVERNLSIHPLTSAMVHISQRQTLYLCISNNTLSHHDHHIPFHAQYKEFPVRKYFTRLVSAWTNKILN